MSDSQPEKEENFSNFLSTETSPEVDFLLFYLALCSKVWESLNSDIATVYEVNIKSHTTSSERRGK